MRKRNFRTWHLVFLIPLVGIIIYFVYPTENHSDVFDVRDFIHSIVITSGLWVGVLSIVKFLWKKFPWEKHPLKHLIIEIILVVTYTNVFAFGLYKIQVFYGFTEPVEDISKELFFTNLITYFITAIHEAVEFYRQWVTNFSKSVRLEKDNIEAKYETLKSQINPHFLFNSLNGLVTLVDENTKAVDYIQNLSEFLRYILKSRDTELVLVRSEVEMMKKYIIIQQLRFGKNLQVDLDIPENYYHYSLPPLVLQMLVENCIKHNIVASDNPLQIAIKASKKEIIVRNNLQKKFENNSTGHGLKNIIERYRFF
ncbi:MAG TPA: hypothetical protein DDX98_03570, partial [Bacteroidales bacterium]|nr:hypothetical protein [Bacteroidales bacterium]